MGDSNKENNLSDTTMSLGDHLEELRARLILILVGLVIGTVICLCFGTRIITFIQGPYTELVPDRPLSVLAPADAFVGYMKISLISGLVISSPWVFYQLWMFVAAGLYPNEKRYIHLAVPFSTALFITGALFFIYVVAPISLSFFLRFGEIIGVSSIWTFQKYVSFVTVLMLVFGIAFQTPIAIFFLNRTGLVSVAALRRSRKYVLLGVFVVAAISTPPDVISQITLALPLYVLFELGILISCLSGRRKTS
ncbi:twin-arginine translocase subunit TatC [Planctomycetota bacterium]